jgi:ribosomal protein L44E
MSANSNHDAMGHDISQKTNTSIGQFTVPLLLQHSKKIKDISLKLKCNDRNTAAQNLQVTK